MNVRILAIAVVLILVALSATQVQTAAPPAGRGQGRGPTGPGLTLTSPAFADGAAIPVKYTSADPAPVSPKLEWTNVPAETASFVLIVYDPDVVRQKTTSDVLHWLVVNIPGTARELPENVPTDAQLPDGTLQAKNDQSRPGWLGPGAPAGGPPHHYMFMLFAVDTKLALGPDATRAEVQSAMIGHMLGKAVLVGRFMRPPRPS